MFNFNAAKRVLGLCLFLGLAGVWGMAQNFDEPFNYADGNLNGQGLWTGADGLQVSAADALTMAGYPLNTADAALILPNANFVERVNADFAADISSGSAYLSCLYQVNGGFTPFSNTSIDLVQNSGFTGSNRAGFGAVNSSGTGNNNSFVLFIGSDSIADNTTNFSTGVTYHVILEYQFVPGAANDVVNLFVSPTVMSLNSLPTPLITGVASGSDPLTEVGQVALKNDNNAGDVLLDGIRITDGNDAVPVELSNFSVE